jgi:hypothetical protein
MNTTSQSARRTMRLLLALYLHDHPPRQHWDRRSSWLWRSLRRRKK